MSKSSGDLLPEGANIESWTCEVNQPKELTVGGLFSLRCQGPPVFFERAQLKIKAPSEKEHVLKLLDAQFTSEKEVRLQVTSYMPGQHSDLKIWLTDGKNFVSLKDLSWQVQSVLQAQPGKPAPTPYGPYGPVRIFLPLWFWILVIVALTGLLIGIGWRIWHKRLRKNMQKKMSEYNTGVSAYNQFNKEVRQLERAYFLGDKRDTQKTQEYVGKLEEVFRLYLVRRFLMPAHEWTTPQIIKELRKYHSEVYKNIGKPLQEILREFNRVGRQDVTNEDCQQFLEECRRITLQIWRMEGKNK